MHILYQCFTVLDNVPHDRDALTRHLKTAAGPAITVNLHGTRQGTYAPSWDLTDAARRGYLLKDAHSSGAKAVRQSHKLELI